jgi:hypothetical protein
MQEVPPWKRLIVCDAPNGALGPQTDVILSRLGYRMVLPATFEQLRGEDAAVAADLMLVDERRLSSFLDSDAWKDGPRVPIVLLTGKNGVVESDLRIVGGVKRPAGLHDLYRLLQHVFEDTPRSTPRVATQIRVRCERGDRNWDGRVLSLSENGCLMRSPETIALGQRNELDRTVNTESSMMRSEIVAKQFVGRKVYSRHTAAIPRPYEGHTKAIAATNAKLTRWCGSITP